MTAPIDDFPAIADQLVLFDVLLDVRVSLTADGAHLALSGNSKAVACATPRLRQLKPRILSYLLARSDSSRTAW